MADIHVSPGPFRAVGSRVVRLAGLRCRLLYPAASSDGGEAPYLSEGRQTSEAWPWSDEATDHEIMGKTWVQFDFVLSEVGTNDI